MSLSDKPDTAADVSVAPLESEAKLQKNPKKRATPSKAAASPSSAKKARKSDFFSVLSSYQRMAQTTNGSSKKS